MMKSAICKAQTSGARERLLRYDRILLVILLAHLPVTMFLVPLGYGTQSFAIYASVLVGIFAVGAYFLLRGTAFFGLVSGILLMMLSAIMIQSQLGRIEMHFHIFVALALLMIYKNWINILVAAGVISAYYLVLTALQLNAVSIGGMPIMLFNYGCSWDITFLHLAFVVLEAIALIAYAILMKRDEWIGAQLVDAVSSIDQNNDFSVQIPDPGGSAAISAFNDMIRQFGTLSTEVASAAMKIKSVSYQLDDIARSAEREISSQHRQTEQAATAITEMSRSITQVSESAQKAAAVAASANEKALDGHEHFNDAARSTTDLQQIMVEASESIRLLERNAVNIGSVVDVIISISEQTNRLALKAASEAASASEPGQGCALVADEARSLAQRTQDAETEIQEIVQKLQKDIESAVTKTHDGQQKTTQTSSEILRAGLALNEILESVSQVSDMNTQIAQAIEEQSSAAESMARKILAISAHSNSVVDKAKQNLSSAATLRKASESLTRAVSAYRT
ncbi:hypothetical protein G3480_18395 [Thiorhodococcus mannitoliphagus]|uniref:Methyl-accepting transducer domain-containing protein n=1 Tax=Thiorhodococcus mannitoliphagus TaxID=329406 RepID=A0A6P1DYZ9_9GAMM|nr:methyl-accepting chemotaxis protein [Thiorhodococcus mannitoliphagus]NEX22251.1 hypothetical protein [Thiorhodococcus mannitoliphagus]